MTHTERAAIDARNALLMEHDKVVVRAACVFYRKNRTSLVKTANSEVEDVIQWARIFAFDAIRRYDPARRTTLARHIFYDLMRSLRVVADCDRHGIRMPHGAASYARSLLTGKPRKNQPSPEKKASIERWLMMVRVTERVRGLYGDRFAGIDAHEFYAPRSEPADVRLEREEDEARRKRETDRLLAALETLPPSQRDAIRASCGIGCEPQTLREISADSGVTFQGIWYRYHFGMKRLRARLEEA